MSDLISREAAIEALFDWEMTYDWDDHCREEDPKPAYIVSPSDVIKQLPSAQPEQRPLTEDDYAYYEECDSEVKCLFCGHHIAERPLEVYCNIMCKWVNEKDYCTMFEPGQEKMRKTEA